MIDSKFFNVFEKKVIKNQPGLEIFTTIHHKSLNDLHAIFFTTFDYSNQMDELIFEVHFND